MDRRQKLLIFGVLKGGGVIGFPLKIGACSGLTVGVKLLPPPVGSGGVVGQVNRGGGGSNLTPTVKAFYKQICLL